MKMNQQDEMIQIGRAIIKALQTQLGNRCWFEVSEAGKGQKCYNNITRLYKTESCLEMPLCDEHFEVVKDWHKTYYHMEYPLV